MKEKHAKSCEIERPKIKEVEGAKNTSNFASQQQRFKFKQVFYGQDLKLTPGPGYYQGKKKTKKGRSNFGRAKKLRALQPSKVGPGSYIKSHGSMIKKSFNMTLDSTWQ